MSLTKDEPSLLFLHFKKRNSKGGDMGRTTAFACVIAATSAVGCVGSEAAPLDCDKIEHSKTPYEMSLSSSKGNSVAQLYRSSDEFVTTFLKLRDGSVAKSIRQGPYAISYESKGITIKTDYNYISTARPIYEYIPRFYDTSVSRTTGGQTEKLPTGGRFIVAFLGKENISVGPCVFPVIHFTETKQNFSDEKHPLTMEKWYSPGLQSSLKFVFRTKNDDGSAKILVETSATGISLDFEPFKFP